MSPVSYTHLTVLNPSPLHDYPPTITPGTETLRPVSSGLHMLMKAPMTHKTSIKQICVLFSYKSVFIGLIFRPRQGPQEC